MVEPYPYLIVVLGIYLFISSALAVAYCMTSENKFYMWNLILLLILTPHILICFLIYKGGLKGIRYLIKHSKFLQKEIPL